MATQHLEEVTNGAPLDPSLQNWQKARYCIDWQGDYTNNPLDYDPDQKTLNLYLRKQKMNTYLYTLLGPPGLSQPYTVQ